MRGTFTLRIVRDNDDLFESDNTAIEATCEICKHVVASLSTITAMDDPALMPTILGRHECPGPDWAQPIIRTIRKILGKEPR